MEAIPILETLPYGPLGLNHCIPWIEYLEEVPRPRDVLSELWTTKVNSQNKTKQKISKHLYEEAFLSML